MSATSIRSRVMALPEAERLDYALDLLDEMAGQRDERIGAIMLQYGLTRIEAMIASVLDARHPAIVSREMMMTAVWGHDASVSDKLIDVFICKLRAKMGRDAIATLWGQGWRLVEPLAVDLAVMHPASRAIHAYRWWSPQEDAELRRMLATGSEPWAIAEELDRTERAVLDRAKLLAARVAA